MTSMGRIWGTSCAPPEIASATAPFAASPGETRNRTGSSEPAQPARQPVVTRWRSFTIQPVTARDRIEWRGLARTGDIAVAVRHPAEIGTQAGYGLFKPCPERGALPDSEPHLPKVVLCGVFAVLRNRSS
ncbi:MAG: hypothetical protein HOY78_00710 [Saccharothrix sp.]|nr:hypothetical protein [Saccharothrix sp.]